MRSAALSILSFSFVLAACSDIPDETDPVFGSSPQGAISSEEIDSWNESAAWGDHAAAGYLETESDPLFAASAVAEVGKGDIEAWNEGVSWGDHAAAGYLREEHDPYFASSVAAEITQADVDTWSLAFFWGDHRTAGYLGAAEFLQTPASTINMDDVARWSLAAAWGDHATAGYLHAAAFEQTPAASITSSAIASWTESHAWGDHGAAGYLSAAEFQSTPAASITSGKVSSWDAAASWGDHREGGYLEYETDPSIGALDQGAIPAWTGSELANSGMYLRDGRLGVGTAEPIGDLDVISTPTSGLVSGASNMAGGDAVNRSADRWQSFIHTVTGYFDFLDLDVFQTDGSTFTLRVYAGQGTGGRLLATNVVTIPAGRAVRTVRLESPPLLVAGETYTFRLSGVAAWLYVNNDYPDGQSHYGDDLLFQVWVDSAEDPRSALSVRRGSVHVGHALVLEPRSEPPGSPQQGEIYFDADLRKIRYFDGSSWVTL